MSDFVDFKQWSVQKHRAQSSSKQRKTEDFDCNVLQPKIQDVTDAEQEQPLSDSDLLIKKLREENRVLKERYTVSFELISYNAYLGFIVELNSFALTICHSIVSCS